MAHPTTKNYSFTVIFMFLLLTTSCYKDNEEHLYPGTACDTENVSFSADIWPVVSSNCVGCHSGAAASGGVRMDNYAEWVEAINGGRVMGAIRHESGFSPMPKGGGKLSNCSVSQIEAWIEDGMPDN